MITTIYLIRHTQTTGNVEKRLTGRQDYEVTDDGMKFVRAMEKELEDIKFDNAYCSTSSRTQKTIQGIANKNNISIIQDEDLCEMYFGIYDGWKWEDVNKINPKIDELHKETNEIMKIPEQEPTEKVATRMYNCILNIAKKNVGKTILICSHGVAIEAFLRIITREPFINKREEYSQKNTSINVIKYKDESSTFEVEKLNYIDHLEKYNEGKKLNLEEKSII